MYTTCSELGIFMYWTGDSINNLLSYCGLVEIKISASEKDLPVQSHCESQVPSLWFWTNQPSFINKPKFLRHFMDMN